MGDYIIATTVVGLAFVIWVIVQTAKNKKNIKLTYKYDEIKKGVEIEEEEYDEYVYSLDIYIEGSDEISLERLRKEKDLQFKDVYPELYQWLLFGTASSFSFVEGDDDDKVEYTLSRRHIPYIRFYCNG
jgi:phosphate/sulfate permease